MPTITRDMVVVIQGLVILFSGALENMFRALARGAALRAGAAPAAGRRGRSLMEDWLVLTVLLAVRDIARRDAADPLRARAALFCERSGRRRHRARRQDARGRLRRRRPPPRSTGSAIGRADRRHPDRAVLGAAARLCLHHPSRQPGRVRRRDQHARGGPHRRVRHCVVQAGRADAAAARRARASCRSPCPVRPRCATLPVIGPLYANCSAATTSSSMRACSPCRVVPLGRLSARASACGCARSARTRLAVDTAGISVAWLRYRAVMICGLLSGIAGTYLVDRAECRFQPRHDRGPGLHRARRADLRQMAARARCSAPACCSACSTRSRSACRACASAAHRRSAGAGHPGAALCADRGAARGLHRQAVAPKAIGVPYVKEH